MCLEVVMAMMKFCCNAVFPTTDAGVNVGDYRGKPRLNCNCNYSVPKLSTGPPSHTEVKKSWLHVRKSRN